MGYNNLLLEARATASAYASSATPDAPVNQGEDHYDGSSLSGSALTGGGDWDNPSYPGEGTEVTTVQYVPVAKEKSNIKSSIGEIIGIGSLLLLFILGMIWANKEFKEFEKKKKKHGFKK